MICPTCNSTEVRRSRRFHWGDSFSWMRGRHAYRCRNCQTRFYGREGASPARRKSGSFRRKLWRKGGGIPKTLRRRLIEVGIFLLLLVVFYLFLRYLTRETIPAEDSRSVPVFSGISES